MGFEVNLKALSGESTTTAIIGKWHKKEGDFVKKGDILLAVETAKVSIDIEAPVSGVIEKILFEEGTEVDINATIAIISNQDEGLKIDAKGSKNGKENNRILRIAEENEEKKGESKKKRINISPLAKKLAKEYNIELNRIKGTGTNKRITKLDLLKFIKELENNKNNVKDSSYKQLTKGSHKTIQLSGRRRTIAQKMFKSYSTIPHATSIIEVKVDKLIDIREYLNKRNNEKISITDLFIFFIAKALKEFPYMNAWFKNDEITIMETINIGVAVDLEEGLLVPVIKNCEKKSLFDLSKELKQLINKAKEGEISPDEVTGGTFTISNLGMYGIKSFIPIINEPETAILGIGVIEQKVCLDNNRINSERVISLSLTHDHRVVDGGPAARFFSKIKELIENPYIMISFK